MRFSLRSVFHTFTGAQFVSKLARANISQEHLDEDTHAIIAHERKARAESHTIHSRGPNRWQHAVSLIHHKRRSKKHYRDHINVSAKEHMSSVDCFDGATMRKMAEQEDRKKDDDAELLVVHPTVDDRLRNEASV